VSTANDEANRGPGGGFNARTSAAIPAAQPAAVLVGLCIFLGFVIFPIFLGTAGALFCCFVLFLLFLFFCPSCGVTDAVANLLLRRTPQPTTIASLDEIVRGQRVSAHQGAFSASVCTERQVSVEICLRLSATLNRVQGLHCRHCDSLPLKTSA